MRGLKDLRPGAVLVCLILLAAGVLGISNAMNRDRCFQYDVTVDSATICGSPEHIDSEQFRRGREMVRSARGVLEDPYGMCLQRAAAQAKMHGWPDRYRDAYINGCTDQDTTGGAK